MKNTRSGAAKGVEVVSAVAGRLRLRVDPDTNLCLETAAAKLRQQKGVQEVRINEQTGSILIVFEPERITQSQLLTVFQQNAVDMPILSESESQAAKQSKAIEQASVQLQSLFPAVAGIMITRSLGISGWQAIPAYLVSTEVIRQTMAQFKQGLPTPLAPDVPYIDINTTAQETKAEETTYKIVHQIPGRIRLYCPCIVQEDYAKQLQQRAVLDNVISSIRLNSATASVVITYDAGVAESEMRSRLERLMAAASVAEPEMPAASLPKSQEDSEIIDITPAEENIAEQPAKESSQFWSCFKASTLSAVLNVMASLPVQSPV